MSKREFLEVTKLVAQRKKCGYTYLKYEFLPDYGIGFYEVYMFDGLYMAVFDVELKQELIFEGTYTENVLLMSFLLEGEQKIKIEDQKNDIIYESQESYLIYLPKVFCSVSHSKKNNFKEVRISMTDEFLKKHQLHQELNKYNYKNITNTEFLHPLCVKKQEILIEILSDNHRDGLLKRLFIEAKTLQLITLQLEHNLISNSKIDTPTKKIYQTQHLISSDLSLHRSIPDISREIGLNDFILKKEFKRMFGKTIFEYTTELRMQKAKDLLLNSKLPICEISESVGYKNPTHFTAAFKRNESITPKNYRTQFIKVS